MITRQILRLIIYYLMPLTIVSILYSVIAKTLCQTKDVVCSSSFRLHSSQNRPVNGKLRFINIQFNKSSRYSQDIFSNYQTTTILNQGVGRKKQIRARHKVAKTVLFLCLVFFICWLPKQMHDLYW